MEAASTQYSHHAPLQDQHLPHCERSLIQDSDMAKSSAGTDEHGLYQRMVDFILLEEGLLSDLWVVEVGS